MLASCLISGLRCLKTLKCLEILLYLQIKICLIFIPTDDTCHIFCIWWLVGSQCWGSQSEDVRIVVTRAGHITGAVCSRPRTWEDWSWLLAGLEPAGSRRHQRSSSPTRQGARDSSRAPGHVPGSGALCTMIGSDGLARREIAFSWW